jgi:hypothetical protein
MVKGYTDQQKKFHPITDYKKVRKSSGKTIKPSGIKLKSDSKEDSIRNKKKTFTSTSGQLLVLKGVEERPDHTQKTIDLLANLKRPKGLPESIGFKNVRDGVAEWTFFADGRYPFTRDGEIDVGRVRNAVARGSQQGVIDQLKRRGLCKVMELSGIKVSIICKGLEG